MATHTLRIVQDENAQAPNEIGDDPVFIVTTRNRYFCPDGQRGWTTEDADRIVQEHGGDDGEHVVFPLYAYVHGGVALSLGGFGDPWDSGQVGYVVFVRSEWGEDATEEDARKVAEAWVKEWNQYLSGDVWGYIVEKHTTCDMGHDHAEVIDSCWGFYGEEEARAQGEEALEYAQDNADTTNETAHT